MIETRTMDTDAGFVQADVLVCDRCGAEAVEESATGWARVETVGLGIHTMEHFPELVVCSWPCLRAVDRRFPLNDEAQGG